MILDQLLLRWNTTRWKFAGIKCSQSALEKREKLRHLKTMPVRSKYLLPIAAHLKGGQLSQYLHITCIKEVSGVFSPPGRVHHCSYRELNRGKKTFCCAIWCDESVVDVYEALRQSTAAPPPASVWIRLKRNQLQSKHKAERRWLQTELEPVWSDEA